MYHQWSKNPLLKFERLSDSLCCLGRKGRAEIAVKNNGIITLWYYYYSLLTDILVLTLAPPYDEFHTSVREITFKYKSAHHTLLLKNHRWFPITFNIFFLCLIFILLQVGQVSWICGLMSSVSFGNFSSHNLLNVYSLSFYPSLPLPPFFLPFSSLPLFLFPLLSPLYPLLSWTPTMHILNHLTSFCRSQMRGKDLSSGKISEICLYSTAGHLLPELWLIPLCFTA